MWDEYLPFSSLLREYNLHLLQIPPLFHYLQGILQPFEPRGAGLAEPSSLSPAPSLPPSLSQGHFWGQHSWLSSDKIKK